MARVAALREGVDEARRICKEVEELCLEDESVTFSLGGVNYTLFLEGGYPGVCQIFDSDGGEELELSGSIREVIDQLLDHRHAQAGRCRGGGTAVVRGAEENDDCSVVETSSPEEAAGTACCEEESEDEDDDALAMLAVVEEDNGLGSALKAEAEAACSVFGKGSAETCSMADSCRLTLKADSSAKGAVTELTAGAWGINLEMPITLRMKVFGAPAGSCTSTTATAGWHSVEELQVYQGSSLEDSCLKPGKQLLMICNDFLKLHKIGSSGNRSGGAASARECARKRRRTPSGVPGEPEEVQIARTSKEVWIEEALRENAGVAQLLRYVSLRLPSLHKFCAICDEPHTSPPMIQRTVCCREICCWQFSQFGELISDAEGVNTAAEVNDLLVCMAIHAAKSPRCTLIFDPFPQLFLDAASSPALSSKSPGAWETLKKVMGEIEEAREEAAGDGALWTIRTDLLTSKGALARPMVQWIASSVRSLLLPLQEEDRVKAFGTAYQYMLVSAAPEREALFQSLKTEFGSTFAFHGSPPENWHSILRNGLKNASSTALMISGAAHGAGIYLSPRSCVSAHYSKLAPAIGNVTAAPNSAGGCDLTGTRRLDLGSLRMLAVCEVINHPSLNKVNNHHIWVAPKEETVVTRFFLVYSANLVPNLDLQDVQLQAKLRTCMKAFGNWSHV